MYNYTNLHQNDAPMKSNYFPRLFYLERLGDPRKGPFFLQGRKCINLIRMYTEKDGINF